MRTRFAIIVGVALVGLASCGRHPPKVDDTKFLSDIGFDQPISVTVQLDRVANPQGQVFLDNNGQITALLWKAGLVEVVPNFSRAPWWNFRVSGGTLQGDTFTVEVAHRKITDHSNDKRWSEGSVDYFAETIAYRLDPVDKLAGVFSADATANSFSLRLATKNDPAVGNWELAERGNEFDKSDGNSLQAWMSASGQKLAPALAQAIHGAQSQVYDQIERNLAADGTLAKSPADPNVLISTKHRLAYYTKFYSVIRISLSEAEQYCANVRTAKYTNWHLASIDELATLDSGQHSIIDTPDWRLWGDLARPNGVDTVNYLSSTPTSGMPGVTEKYYSGNGYYARNGESPRADGYFQGGIYRLICVAPL